MVNSLFLPFLLQSLDADPYSGLAVLYSDGNFTETSLIETEVLFSSCDRDNTFFLTKKWKICLVLFLTQETEALQK